MKYAHWDGSAWQKQTVQIRAREISFYTSITVDSEDRPSISFYEYTSASSDESVRLRLRVVMWNGSYWQVRTVDPEPGSGKFNSIASDSAGNAIVAYANVKYEGTSLRFARWNGQTWSTERVEGAGERARRVSVCLALDSKDTPHIAYTDVPNRKVKYATRRDSKWHTETVDAVTDVSYPDRNGIAVDAEGNPYITFHDPGQGILKIARKTGKCMGH